MRQIDNLFEKPIKDFVRATGYQPTVHILFGNISDNTLYQVIIEALGCEASGFICNDNEKEMIDVMFERLKTRVTRRAREISHSLHDVPVGVNTVNTISTADFRELCDSPEEVQRG